MALQRYTIDGYGVLELNQASFRRAGKIEAQSALSESDFTADDPAENGMLLEIDYASRTVQLPAGGDSIGLVYSEEKLYDERLKGLKNFKMVPGEFYPRLGFVSEGDRFTTNCLAYDDVEFADDDAVDTALAALGTTAVYGQACANGAI